MNTYWLRQTASKPLYPDMLWSRPENRAYAGKLAIIGGNAQGFSSPALAFKEAEKAGAGSIRTLLPASLYKTLGRTFDGSEFAPSTPSGSFSQKSLAEWLSLAMWADAVILDGDMGRNSETAIVIEKFTNKYAGPIVYSTDSVDYLLSTESLAGVALDREATTIVADFPQLQKLFIAAHSPRALTSTMDIVRFVEGLHLFTLQHQAGIVTRFADRLFVTVEGQVADTPTTLSHDTWQTITAAHAAVWWMQNPSKPFAALTSSLLRD